MRIARDAGRTLVHRPMDLTAVVAAGGATPTTKRTAAHRAYFFGREIERWSEERNAPVVTGMPTHHWNDTTLSNCLLIAAANDGQAVDALAHAFLEAHWRDDADLADVAALRSIASTVECDIEALIEAAQTPAVKAQYEAYTQEAIERSVFGSPTYFVDGDMFYGQDRLEMIEKALKTPYRRVS